MVERVEHMKFNVLIDNTKQQPVKDQTRFQWSTLLAINKVLLAKIKSAYPTIAKSLTFKT